MNFAAIINKKFLFDLLDMPISDRYSYWETELRIIEVRRSNQCLKLIMRIFAILFDAMMDSLDFFGFLRPERSSLESCQLIVEFC